MQKNSSISALPLATPAVLDMATAPVRISRAKRWLKACPPLVMAGIAWIVLMLVVALFANYLAPYTYSALDLKARLQPPVFLGGEASHWLGTDELGRDVLSRLIISIQISLLIAFISTLISAFIGMVLGFLAAHFRGWVEQLVLVLIDFQASLPFMIIALAVLAFFGNSLTLFIVLMGCYGWDRTARITRSLTIAANEQGYASAVHDIGASPWRVYIRHVLPNIASTIIVSVTLTFPEIILLESGLSFLGLGVQPPMTSLGNMVGYGREYLQSAPWILLAPSLIIVLTTFFISIVGDWLRDRLDPTLR
ncbi:ABC transporter permease [Advenella sp. RU8]|jgi:peptide/nickel transport system permease protein|uniref:ABC transporter permease n=1 Tax=unclassified Advenella TaxID=2685285 RepID=UPI0020071600|nr:ABC transporter permease [Advenella sp. EE-W14]